MKKAILIDSMNRTIKQVEVGGLEDIYKVMGVELIQVATYMENGDVVYVDEEGLYNANRNWFTIQGGHQPFIGNALVIGTDNRTGDDADAKSTVEDIETVVRFVSEVDVALMSLLF